MTILLAALLSLPPNACVARTCDDLAALHVQVASLEVPGVHGLANHLEVAHRMCVEGKLAPAIAQLGAFTHQVARQPDAAEVIAYVETLRARLDRAAAGEPCVAPLGPVGLAAQCPLAGDLAPLADDFTDGAAAPAWMTVIGPDTVASVAETGGALALRSGPLAAGALGQSPYGYVSACAYPSQDLAVSADLHIDAGATGEYSAQLHADGAALYLGFETTADHGFVSILFADQPGPDAWAVALPDLRGRDLGLTLTRTTTAGVQALSATVVDHATGEVIFADRAARATATTAPSRAAILAGFVPGDAPLALATDVTLHVRNYRSTLIGALPSFAGGHAPLSLDGVAYADRGTHYLVGGELTVVTSGGIVAGADGTTALAAVLVDDGAARVTYYTDLDRAAFALVLAAVSPGSSISAYVAGVLQPTGPGSDYAVVL